MTGTANAPIAFQDVGGTSQMWKVEHTPEGTVRLRSQQVASAWDTVGIGARWALCCDLAGSTPAVATPSAVGHLW